MNDEHRVESQSETEQILTKDAAGSAENGVQGDDCDNTTEEEDPNLRRPI